MYTRRVEVTDSSNIMRIWYDRDEFVMTVQFANLAEYRYRNVVPADFGEIVAANSVGSAFNGLLRKNGWPTEKIGG